MICAIRLLNCITLCLSERQTWRLYTCPWPKIVTSYISGYDLVSSWCSMGWPRGTHCFRMFSTSGVGAFSHVHVALHDISCSRWQCERLTLRAHQANAFSFPAFITNVYEYTGCNNWICWDVIERFFGERCIQICEFTTVCILTWFWNINSYRLGSFLASCRLLRWCFMWNRWKASTYRRIADK